MIFAWCDLGPHLPLLLSGVATDTKATSEKQNKYSVFSMSCFFAYEVLLNRMSF